MPFKAMFSVRMIKNRHAFLVGLFLPAHYFLNLAKLNDCTMEQALVRGS